MRLNVCEVNTCFTPTKVSVASFFQRFQKLQDKWPHSFGCAVRFGKFWGDRYAEILYKLSVELHKSYNYCPPTKKHRGLAAKPSRCLRLCVNIVLQIQPVLNAGILLCARCLFSQTAGLWSYNSWHRTNNLFEQKPHRGFHLLQHLIAWVDVFFKR